MSLKLREFLEQIRTAQDQGTQFASAIDAIKHLGDRIADLEARLSQVENGVFVGVDTTAIAPLAPVVEAPVTPVGEAPVAPVVEVPAAPVVSEVMTVFGAPAASVVESTVR